MSFGLARQKILFREKKPFYWVKEENIKIAVYKHYRVTIMDTFYSLSSETNFKWSGGWGQKVNATFFVQFQYYIL